MKTEQKKLIADLDRSIAHLDTLFAPGLFNKCRRFLLHPRVIITRMLYERSTIISKRQYQVKTKTFFKYPMITHGFNYCFRIGGCLVGAEVPFQKYLIKYLPHNSIFFDIGAHHGYYSLLAHKLMREGTGEIHSFEPVELHFSIFSKSIRLLSNGPKVYCNQLALGAQEESLNLYEDIGGGSTIEKSFYDNVQKVDQSIFSPITVQATTLDSYCKNAHVKPTFLKIDVEGSEYDVIRGAKHVLEENKPRIVMEVWSKPYDNTNHIKAVCLLHEFGYKAYHLNADGDPEYIELQNLLSKIEEPGKFENYLFQ